MLGMCPEAWYIFIRTIQLCAVLLLCAFMLLVEWNGSMNENYELYVLANGLNEIAQAILLIGVLFSVLLMGEALTSRLLAGFVLIFLSIILSETHFDFLRRNNCAQL